MYATDIDIEKLAEMSATQRTTYRNAVQVKEWIGGWKRRWDHHFREAHGYGLIETLRKPGFNLREARKQLRERYKLSESVTTSQLYALTTGMAALTMTDAYQLVKVVYRSIAEILPSDSSEEEYDAVQRGDIPVPVGDNEDLPESALAGILVRIRNYRFGRRIKISRTAIEDDKTGVLKRRAADLGDGMAYAEERWWVYMLFSTYVNANIRGGNGSNPIVPPMNIAGQAPAGYGGPATVAGPVYTQANVENLLTAADYVTDIKGEWTLVQPNALLAANADKFAVKKMFASMYNPSTPPAGAGVIGGIFSENVLKGELDIFFSPFVGKARAGIDGLTNPWAVGESGKFGVFQNRTPLDVETEVPNAGDSFKTNSMHTKAERRFGAGVRLPEFVLAGN